jgi:capsular polysaccharide transport system permease protein
MIDRIKENRFSKALARTSKWAHSRLVPALIQRRVFGMAAVASVLAVLFWGFVASDRYVSEAQVIIQRTDMASSQNMDFTSLLAGATSGNRTDQLLLRSHLLSVDMLNKLDAKLDLRAHYSDTSRDPITRLWSANVPQEWFHRHYLKRVKITFDEYAGILVIEAQAYDPKTAQAITRMLVEEGERTMNEMGHRLAQEQVAFVERQVHEIGEKFQRARTDLVAYQNAKGMVSPQSTAESMAAVVNRLEGQRTELQARRSAMIGYLSPAAPSVIEIDLQIGAIESQIKREQARLTGASGKTLNSTVEEFQRLQMAAEFAQDIYKTALVALEKGRVEATRTLKKVSVLQSPTLPEYPVRPRRIYNAVVFILIALLLAGIAHLIAAIIRDHKD